MLYLKRYFIYVSIGFIFLNIIPIAEGRDQASITWIELKQDAELILLGYLVKAEIDAPPQLTYKYTYRIDTVFKGPSLKEVTFFVTDWDIPRANQPLGQRCFLFLKKKNNHWVLSFDDRSIWPVQYMIGKAFRRRVIIVEIPTSLIRDFPDTLSSTAVLKVLNPVDQQYHDIESKVFLFETIKNEFETLLNQKSAIP